MVLILFASIRLDISSLTEKDRNHRAGRVWLSSDVFTAFGSRKGLSHKARGRNPVVPS